MFCSNISEQFYRVGSLTFHDRKWARTSLWCSWKYLQKVNVHELIKYSETLVLMCIKNKLNARFKNVLSFYTKVTRQNDEKNPWNMVTGVFHYDTASNKKRLIFISFRKLWLYLPLLHFYLHHVEWRHFIFCLFSPGMDILHLISALSSALIGWQWMLRFVTLHRHGRAKVSPIW